VLPHGPLTAHRRAREHGLTERSNDPEVILPTVSAWDQHFVLLSSVEDGQLDLRCAFDPVAVREFYEDRCSSELLQATHGTKELNGPWYALRDTVGVYNVVTTGEERAQRVAVLFPTWTDGIIGEIMWTEPNWSWMPPDWGTEAVAGHRLEALEAAWRENDFDGMLASFEDDSRSVIRRTDIAGLWRTRAVARGKAELMAAWCAPDTGRVVSLERINRVVSHFYVFVAHVLEIERRDGRFDREMACLFPLGRNGRFIGEFSYSFEKAR
jgi:hypothetical protein